MVLFLRMSFGIVSATIGIFIQLRTENVRSVMPIGIHPQIQDSEKS